MTSWELEERNRVAATNERLDEEFHRRETERILTALVGKTVQSAATLKDVYRLVFTDGTAINFGATLHFLGDDEPSPTMEYQEGRNDGA